MMITATVPKTMAIAANVKPTKKVMITYKDDYFIIGRTLEGGFHLSEDICEDKVLDVFSDYCSLVSYFGGGTVDICRKTYDYYEVLFSKVIF